MRLILAATAALALTACGNTDTMYHPPKFPQPTYEEPKIDPSKLKLDLPDLSKLEAMMICNKPPKESELTPEVKAKALNVRDTIEIQDVETVDCDGKKTFEAKQTQKSFQPILQIHPPSTLRVKATSASVENLTTCVTRDVKHSTTVKRLDSESDAKRKLMWMLEPAAIDDQNVIVIELNDMALKMGTSGLNVVNGLNLLKVTYKNSHGDEISHERVLVNVHIDRKDLQGVKTVNNCKQ